jgi:hypothetical protein
MGQALVCQASAIFFQSLSSAEAMGCDGAELDGNF